EFVRPVDHHIIWLDDRQRNGRGQRLVVHIEADVRADVEQRIYGALQPGAPDILRAVDDLALKVGRVYHVVIDEADAPHACRRKIHAEWRAKPARTDDQYTGRLQLALARHADLRHDQVTVVAPDLLVAELYRFRSDAILNGHAVYFYTTS